MGLAIAICTLLLAGAVVLVVSAPLRRGARRTDLGDPSTQPPAGGDRGGESATAQRDPKRDELQTAREAKYREIRDAELDYRTGKLSDADYRAIDTELRAEALAILDELERQPPGVESKGPGG